MQFRGYLLEIVSQKQQIDKMRGAINFASDKIIFYYVCGGLSCNLKECVLIL